MSDDVLKDGVRPERILELVRHFGPTGASVDDLMAMLGRDEPPPDPDHRVPSLARLRYEKARGDVRVILLRLTVTGTLKTVARRPDLRFALA